MKKIPKKAYTAEFKELAVKRVSDGQTITEAAKELGLSSQSLRNWIKAAVAGKLTGSVAVRSAGQAMVICGGLLMKRASRTAVRETTESRPDISSALS